MYNIETIGFFFEACELWCGGPSGMYGKRMLELGNQTVWEHARKRMGVPYETAKEWFSHLGIHHVSVDLNGKDGALALDISRPVEIQGETKFDVVTNIGTSEHVLTPRGQVECFANVHRHCRIGGLMIHTIPPVGQWGGHCATLYQPDFLEALAKLNGYRILLNKRVALETVNPNVDLFCAAFVKEHDEDFADNGTLLDLITYDEGNDDALRARG